MTFKKTIALLVALVMLFTVVLTGCGSKDGGAKEDNPKTSEQTTTQGTQQESTESNTYENGLPKDEKVTLKILAPNAGYGKEMYEQAASKFQEMYPNVKIELTCTPQLGEVVTPRISANDDKEMFDLVMNNAGYTKQLADSGVVEDLSAFLDMPTWDNKDVKMKEDILESSRKLYIYKDKIYVMPMDLGLIALIYNKTMFEENGWNEDPKTWGEFLDLCEQIKKSGKADPIAFGGTVGYLPWLVMNAPIYAGGSEWAERYVRRDKGIYSDPATLAPFIKLKILKEKGYFLKGTEALDHLQSQMEFVQGKAAIVPCGNWIENEMKTSAPEGFRYGIMVPPTNDNPADTKYIQGWSSGMWMWANKPELNKKWTKEFMRYYLSKEIQSIYIKNGGIPACKSAVSDSNVTKQAGPFNKEVLKLLSGKVELFVTLALPPAPKVAASSKLKDVDKIRGGDGYMAVFLGKKTPEQIGKEADAMLEEAWKEVGGR